MRMRFGVLAAGLMSAMIWGCGGGNDVQQSVGPDGGSTDAGQGDAGTCSSGAPCPDGGIDAGIDAGTDAGADAGTDGGTDAGTPPPDGGTDAGTGDAGPVTVTFPNSAGWTFYGPESGAPQDVYDSATDEAGNLWVAGGSEGLFLLKAGSTTFVKYGIAEGLHPYGYLTGAMAQFKGVPEGSPADPSPDLANTPVISVAGGPAGTVFVGYQGKPGCESNWNWQCATCAQFASDGKTCVKCGQATSPSTWGDPAVYKSGDADRVNLNADGTIAVTHYDIFSGPDVVGAEEGGRERLCSVFRMTYDKAKDEIVFGANHGFAVGKASYVEDVACGGEYSGSSQHTDCVGVYEHSHPAINACSSELVNGHCSNPIFLTDAYFGVAVDPATHDLWMGGANRSTKYHIGSYGSGLGGYYDAEDDTEASPDPSVACKHGMPCGIADRWDLWPDQVPEWDATIDPNTGKARGVNFVTPLQRSTPGKSTPDFALDDAVSGMAATADGKAWVSSFAHGLIEIDSNGNRLTDATGKMMTVNISSVVLDPVDQSVWAGMQWGLGISRFDPSNNAVTNYSNATFGNQLANATIGNIQLGSAGPARSMIVSFRGQPTRLVGNPQTAPLKTAGAVGIYTGQ